MWMRLALCVLIVESGCDVPVDIGTNLRPPGDRRAVSFGDGLLPLEGSCIDACGGQASGADCWCDETCHVNRDCCRDKLSLCGQVSGSCAGACGGPSDSGNCWCDSVCQELVDCCSDKREVCGDPVSGSCAGACGTSPAAGECFCDEGCTSFGDCCSDFGDLCGVGPDGTIGERCGSIVCGVADLCCNASCEICSFFPGDCSQDPC